MEKTANQGTPASTEPTVLTVRETQKLLRLSHNAVYSGIASGAIPSIRVGRKILVPLKALQALLDCK